ncbi:MAG: tryptophan synthase subunit alpha [Planctomycetota bacterium]|nr:MAG: tryptophan synthase subunit alpha [Planctomycetota bacterium]
MSSNAENRIERIFAELRASDARALMPFVCAQHPFPDATGPMLEAVASAGASVIEVGIPFSDPIADGPVIAAAMHEALQQGSHPRAVFEQVRSVRDRIEAGLVAMVSVSIVYRFGVERFISEAASAGFDGFIFPDAPLEWSDELTSRARDAGLIASLLIAPTTPPERAERIAGACSGFIYLLARAGITGERDEAPRIERRVAQLREVTDLPIACGFGISTPEHVHAVTRHADAAIVGSALVRRIDQAHREGRSAIEAAGQFVRELAAGLQKEG